MNHRFPRMTLAALAGCVSLALLAAAPLPADAPLVTDGTIVVDVADFEGALLRIPEQYRGEVRMSHERIATLVDQVFLARVLADRARKAGLDQDPAVKKRLVQVQDAFLADLYVKKFEKEGVAGNLEQRARELYQSEREKYVSQDQVRVEEVLVDLKGRTKEMARERAQKVSDEAKAGKTEFLELALKYSDEPTRTGMRGDLGWNAPSKFPAPIRDALAKMKKGEVSAPIETDNGYAVVRLVDRKATEPVPFEAVKDKIVAAEKARLEKERVDALIREIRSSHTATVNTENVEALVVPLDPELMKRALTAEPGKEPPPRTPAPGGK
jgi:peptidyl-prolyl cis-trans isomerase C